MTDEPTTVRAAGLAEYLAWALDPANDHLRAGVPAEEWPDLYEDLARQAEAAAT
jgi:hypothetical protein